MDDRERLAGTSARHDDVRGPAVMAGPLFFVGVPELLHRRVAEDAEETSEVVDDAFDSVAHVRDVEIEKQAQSVAAQSQVGEELSLVNRRSAEATVLSSTITDSSTMQVDSIAAPAA